MKTPKEIIESFKIPHIASIGVDYVISKCKLEEMIKVTQKDAYNQAIDDAISMINCDDYKVVESRIKSLKK